MANPFRDMGVSDAELERVINDSAEVKSAELATAKKMVAFAKSIAPKRTGEFAASIRVATTRKGVVRVGSSLWYAHFIEYGTGPDTKTGSNFGQDTPTPEFAVFARTATAFGGTPDGEGDLGDG